VHGVLIDEIDADKVINAVTSIRTTLKENPSHYIDTNMEQARKFDTKHFIQNIRNEIEKSTSQLKK
ncbi:MAG: hypothetical protein K9M11_03715, partial [Candidatus Pacebacteria bacterium]|nr:hypothetical protein [Candidatus Paceibacterota bacterium]